MAIPKIGDINKFSFGEMTSNDTGKTSSTSTAGVYIIFIGGLCFLLGCIDKMFLDKSIDPDWRCKIGMDVAPTLNT